MSYKGLFGAAYGLSLISQDSFFNPRERIATSRNQQKIKPKSKTVKKRRQRNKAAGIARKRNRK